MTPRLFLAAVVISVGLLIVAKVYQVQGNYKGFKICNLVSSLVLVAVICTTVVNLVLAIGQIFF